MEVAITRMSSKGQIVIPIEMREGLQEGDKMIIIQNKDQIILKKVVTFRSMQVIVKNVRKKQNSFLIITLKKNMFLTHVVYAILL